jgi:EAL domain-containing protein (putative c-di-GMP-specific phosphodiesterase class I)
MVRLTDEVLDQALAQAARWRGGSGHPDVLVAVNVSARDLGDPGFGDRVADALTRHQVPAELLVLEITERLLIGDFALGAEVLGRLRAIGVRISLDDFGTGYSSLTLLKALPVNQIKIDRSFVASIHDVRADATIVRSIVELAHGLGLAVVAEGVETEESLHSLAAMGCDQVQGWLIGRPMPTEAVGAWIAAHRDANATAERLASAPVG